MTRPLLETGIHHLAVTVVSLDRAARFYGEVLGLEVRTEHRREDGSLRSIWYALDEDRFLAVEEVEGGDVRSDDAPGWHCVALPIAVEAREAWRAHLEAHGVRVERESDYTLYVRDPEGALVALSHYPAK